MYAIYDKRVDNGEEHFRFNREVSLFGCRSGEIVRLLSGAVQDGRVAPPTWHLDLGEELRKSEGNPQEVLVINLKPNSKTHNLSLYEISDVWGWSENGWTPIMLHLRGLVIDDTSQTIDAQDFSLKTNYISDPIFSMLYLDGSIEGGKLSGKWTAPRPSATNSCLLWPKVFEHFDSQRRKLMPRIG